MRYSLAIRRPHLERLLQLNREKQRVQTMINAALVELERQMLAAADRLTVVIADAESRVRHVGELHT